MRVSIVGAGYVGLVTGACLAEKGHDVILVEVDPVKVEKINHGNTPIFEKGLEPLLQKHAGKSLRATGDLQFAVLNSEITFIAVGTPFDGKTIDLKWVQQASEQIGSALKSKSSYHIVVVKSTVVPGTTDHTVQSALETHSGKLNGDGFGIAMNPEFLTEGEAVSDFMNPDRIVLGANHLPTLEILEKLYSVFPGVPLFKTNCKTAEMIKYASNALLANLISFSNELANLGSALGGIDSTEVMEGLHLSRYLRPLSSEGAPISAPIVSFLMPGCGFGGSCLPKDVKALVSQGQSVGQPMAILEAVLETNQNQYQRLLNLLLKHIPELSGKKIAVLGLSFRPDTDDMRESPAIPIIQFLIKSGALVNVFDPASMPVAIQYFGNRVIYSPTMESAVENIEAVLLVTRWDAFKILPTLFKQIPNPPLFIDGRRMFKPHHFTRYEGIGI